MATDASVTYEWRGNAGESELDWLHAEAFDHPPEPAPWQRQLEDHSLGWVCARIEEELVGFVNVIWDGATHAVLLDTMVLPSERHLGIGKALVRLGAHEARRAGCAWLHADFDRDLAAFYLESCGFRPTEAGLLDLRHLPPPDPVSAPPGDSGSMPPADPVSAPPADAGSMPPADAGWMQPADPGSAQPADAGWMQPADPVSAQPGDAASQPADPGFMPPASG